MLILNGIRSGKYVEEVEEHYISKFQSLTQVRSEVEQNGQLITGKIRLLPNLYKFIAYIF